MLSMIADESGKVSTEAAPRVIVFPEGLVGCEDWRRFELLEDPEGGPVKLLQSLDDPSIGLLVTDPSLIQPDYRVDISEFDARTLELTRQDQVLVLCTLTVREHLTEVTANLLGPLVINPRTGLGKQVVLANSGYTARHPVQLAAG